MTEEMKELLKDFNYNETEEGIVITGFSGDAVSGLIIPEGVSMIGEDAFMNNAAIKSVVIPKTLKKIEVDAFNGCSGIESIVFAEGEGEKDLTIGAYAFAMCDNFYDQHFPKRVKEIGVGAFAGCFELENISFEEGVGIIDDQAFQECDRLRKIVLPDSAILNGVPFDECVLDSITVGENNPRYKSIKGDLYDKEGKTLVQYATAKSGKSFVLPEGVEVIGRKAFAGSVYLEKVVLPVGLKKIDVGAFERCKKIERVDLPEGLLEIGALAFCDCHKIENITIPEGVKTIDDNAFRSCKSLERIVIPDSVENDFCDAFSECENVKEIIVGEGNKEFKTIDGSLYDKEGTSLLQYALGREDETFVVPETVDWIRPSAFEGCKTVKKIVLHGGFKKVDYYAFYCCNALETIVLPDGLKEIDDNAFTYCALKELIIPDGVERIGESAFMRCDKLKSLTIPKSVKEIGGCAFMWCRELSVKVPKEAKVGDLAFEDCKNVEFY